MNPKNHFADVLGVTELQVRGRLHAAFQQLFHGEQNSERIYYGTGDEEAYIFDVLQDDTRMDALGYGMMISVQLNHQEEFDNIWAYAKKYLRHSTGPAAGYFALTCPVLSQNCPGGYSSFGTFYAVTALWFAERRWADSGRFNYREDAEEQLGLMIEKESLNGGVVDGVTNLFSLETALPTRLSGDGARWEVSIGSLLPAFFEIWGRYASSSFWDTTSAASRSLLRKTSHPETGLFPDVAAPDGTLFANEEPRFNETCYHVFLSIALDYSWHMADNEQVAMANRAVRFFTGFGGQYPAVFNINGERRNELPSGALVAMNGAIAGIATVPEREAFIRTVWETEMPTGLFRFFDGVYQLLSLMYLGGHYRIY